MDNRDVFITNKNSLIPKHKCEHESFEYYKYEIAKRRDENQCQVSIYEIPPKKAGYPYHYHTKSEEVFYIISGSGILETPVGNRPVAAGDVIICPPNEKGAHKLINSSEEEMLVYLDCDTIHSPDVAYYPHSNKVGIITTGQSDAFYKSDDKVDYYEGE